MCSIWLFIAAAIDFLCTLATHGSISIPSDDHFFQTRFPAHVSNVSLMIFCSLLFLLIYSAVDCSIALLDPPLRRGELGAGGAGRARPQVDRGGRVGRKDQGLHQGSARVHGKDNQHNGHIRWVKDMIYAAYLYRE